MIRPACFGYKRLNSLFSQREPVMSEILVPVSFGELLDKIAILQIKS